MKENFGHKKFFVIKKIYYEKILVTKKTNLGKNLFKKNFCYKKKNLSSKIFVIKNFLYGKIFVTMKFLS